jgi:hypothetical protein
VKAILDTLFILLLVAAIIGILHTAYLLFQ